MDKPFPHLTEEAVRDYLQHLVEELDDLDQDDGLGTEGWRSFFGLENSGL